MQRLEVSGAVRPLYGSIGVKGFLSPEIATSVNTRVPFLSSPFVISCLLLRMVLSVYTSWFCSMATLPSLSVSTNFGTWSYQCSWSVIIILIMFVVFIIVVVVSCHSPFLPGTSLEPAVIPTAHASSFTLQYFPYYVWCSKYSCLSYWIYRMFSWYSFQNFL